MKLGLLKIENNKIVSAVYFDSKFERELGDKINYLGSMHFVAVIADSRNEVIGSLNKVIKKQNAEISKRNRAANAIANAEFYKILLETIKNIESL